MEKQKEGRALTMLLIGIICIAFCGCSHYKYKVKGKFQIQGRTSSPGSVALALAQAEAIRAEAQVTRRCAKNPEKCYGGYGAGGYLDTPNGYTMAGINSGRSASQSQELQALKGRVNAMDRAQNTFLRRLKSLRKQKKSKRRKRNRR